MKKSLASLVLAAAALCMQGVSFAQDAQFISYENNESVAAPADNASCPDCNCPKGWLGGCVSGCEECPRLSLGAQLGVDTFRGFSDGTYQSNFGVVGGVFAGMPVMERYGLGAQIGMTQGIYDISGRVSSANRSGSEQQTFFTTGLFHRAHEGQRLSYGVVYDFMIAKNWGTYAVAPTMGQWRGQIEWALNDCNAFGVYGTLNDRTATQTLGPIQVVDRSINQVDFFWHHKFECGADGRFWIGVPEDKRLTGDGSLGEFIYGLSMELPISGSVSLYGAAQYMQPSATAGAFASVEDAYNVAIGLVWYPGRNARTSSVAGGCWTPYLPTANNSTFLVDQSRTL
jgi:hypothetical protein